MQRISNKLTVFFEDPFWVGIYERITDGKLEVCKITFGAEPKDYEVYQFVMQNWDALHFSSPVETDIASGAKMNPKRMQRAVRKQLADQGVGTKSQQALKLQHDENKNARKKKSREQKEAAQELKFSLRQQKRKEKHRGR